MNPKFFSDQCLILKRHNYGEADRLVTLFSRNNGKLTAIAKGVRKTTSRKSPHLEPFGLTKLYFAGGYNLPIITQAETIASFDSLKSNLPVLKHVFHLAEIIDKIFAEQQAYPEIFDRLIAFLNKLDDASSNFTTENEVAIVRFQVDLLDSLGFGHPKVSDQESLIGYIENIADRKLTAKAKLS